MTDNYTSVSIKSQVSKKIQRLSKKEKHTISDQLEIVIHHYLSTGGNQ